MQEVHVDSQMTAVKLDEETGLPADKAVDITAETAEETIAETAAGDAPFDEPQPDCGPFGSGLMDLCTFGLKGNETASLAGAKDEGISADKIVQDLVDTEAQMSHADEESALNKTGGTVRTSKYSNTERELVAPVAPAPAPTDEDGKSEKTQDTILSRVVRRPLSRSTIAWYVLVIFVFLAMCGLFVVGGIFFRKNGW